MAYELLDSPPRIEDFTPLSAHQEQTPTTFFPARPVLHLHCAEAKVRIAKGELTAQPDFAALWDGTSTAQGDDDSAEISGVDVWVDSRHLTLWSAAKARGIQVPYPTITLHAQVQNAVLLQLSLSDPNITEDEDLESVQLHVVPSAGGVSGGHESAETETAQQANGDGVASPAPDQQLYDAISACQELNPDPDPDDENAGLDQTAPGATGWITSENMADFMDEDGNFRVPQGMTVIGDEVNDPISEVGGLSAGAGRRRGANEVDAEDGADDETKWQRTG